MKIVLTSLILFAFVLPAALAEAQEPAVPTVEQAEAPAAAGALQSLVAYGAQDVYLTGNPQITHFTPIRQIGPIRQMLMNCHARVHFNGHRRIMSGMGGLAYSN